MWITFNDDTVDFIWHFDYYIDGWTSGKKKPTFISTVREHFTMKATASYDPDTGLVQGRFRFEWYLNEDGTLVHPYDPFPPIGGTKMTFYLTKTTS